MDVSKITLADLDRREAEERFAQETADVVEVPKAQIELADALSRIFGFDLEDPDQLAADFVDGYPTDTGSETAALRAANALAALFYDRDRTEGVKLWAEVKAALAGAISKVAVSSARGQLAVEDLYRDAPAAKARISAARAAAAADPVDQIKQEAVHG